jgi:hypothetical protein
MADVRYHRHDLALVHDRGRGQYADTCAPGIGTKDRGRRRDTVISHHPSRL